MNSKIYYIILTGMFLLTSACSSINPSQTCQEKHNCAGQESCDISKGCSERTPKPPTNEKVTCPANSCKVGEQSCKNSLHSICQLGKNGCGVQSHPTKCIDGSACLQNKCVQTCTQHSECGGMEVCEKGFCVGCPTSCRRVKKSCRRQSTSCPPREVGCERSARVCEEIDYCDKLNCQK